MDILIGCDFHKGFQQISLLNRETGETKRMRLAHPEEAAEWYRQLPSGAVVGMETSCRARWFEQLLTACGHTLLVGHAQKIRAMEVRRQKTDARDADHLLDLLVQNRFPAVWQPSEQVRDRRCLVLHRHSLVRMRTRVLNQMGAMGRSEGLQLKVSQRAGRKAFEQLSLTGWGERRRRDLLAMLDQLNAQIEELDQAIEAMVEQDPVCRLLKTHPGVGPITAAWLPLVIGDPERFERPRQLASYLGLIPAEYSSGGKQRFGRISKQGNSIARFLLLEAAQRAAQQDRALQSMYQHLARGKGKARAKVAVARKLAIRLFLMWKRGLSYEAWQAGARSHAGSARVAVGR